MKPAKDNSGSGNRENNMPGNNIRSSINKPVSASGSSENNNNVKNSSSGKKEGRKDFRSSRRWRGNRNRSRDRNKERENNEQDRDKPVLKCELCGKDIKEISSAIAMQGSQNPVHFDCMLEKLRKENPLQNNEKIVYLGAGNFGIVKQEKNKPAREFEIVKKIEVENRDDKPEWRSSQLKVK